MHRPSTLSDALRNRLRQTAEDWRRTPTEDRRVVVLAGAAGTGKTLAAEVLASTLGRDLFRIDLSTIVSKYIGELESNLARVLETLALDRTVLFFDEADAIFGVRTEVDDAHDRHAAADRLLERLEAAGACAVVTVRDGAPVRAAWGERVAITTLA